MLQVTFKFDVGDKAWVMHANKPCQCTINHVNFRTSVDEKVRENLYQKGYTKFCIFYQYIIKSHGRPYYGTCPEEKLFATKRELLKSFLDDEVAPIESGQK